MGNYAELLKKLAAEESLLQFGRFDNETAWELGLKFVEMAKQEHKAITIHIEKNGQQLFHYSFGGTAPDNDQWIRRKSNTVNRFFRSSLYIATWLKDEGVTIEEKFHISSFEYLPCGGAFPLVVKNAGTVGVITVSGLTPEEDHDMVVRTITEYLRLN